ncbi:hypothetical protein ABC733_16945, partial [Mangrovibacter sp. SLW1]
STELSLLSGLPGRFCKLKWVGTLVFNVIGGSDQLLIIDQQKRLAKNCFGLYGCSVQEGD